MAESHEAGQAGAEIEVTPEMIEVGFRVLCDSGIVDDPLEADKCTVAEVYRAMALLRQH